MHPMPAWSTQLHHLLPQAGQGSTGAFRTLLWAFYGSWEERSAPCTVGSAPDLEGHGGSRLLFDENQQAAALCHVPKRQQKGCLFWPQSPDLMIQKQLATAC